MVEFSIFNELSLPLDEHEAQSKFGLFFKLLRGLRDKNLNKIRMTSSFKNYNILEGVTFDKFLGQQTNKDFCIRLKSFINNNVIQINTPIIGSSDEEESDIKNETEYFYNNEPTDGGLACCDIWGTIAVSFNSDEWDESKIKIKKQIIDKDASIIDSEISISHASLKAHLDEHSVFFSDLETEVRLNITKDNFWEKRLEYFPSKIIFCPEVELQISKLNKKTFKLAINILRDVETERKSITDSNYSSESKTVLTNPKLLCQRKFTVNEQKKLFKNHIKSLPDHNRIYFLEENNKIYIGYIGKHLPIE